MPTTSKTRSKKKPIKVNQERAKQKAPPPEGRAESTEVTQDARITLELNGEKYTAEIKLWKELNPSAR